jgi:transposase-like protein
MPKGYPSLTQQQKEEIVKRIKEKGERVTDLAKEYGVLPKTIYNFLARSVEGSNTMLELAKLQRKYDALLQIIGQLTVDQTLAKKNFKK